MKKVLSFDFDYSKEDDVLTIFDYSKPIKETIEFSEILNVSIGKNGEIVGLEIFDTGEFLKALNPEINKDFLSKLKKVELEQIEFRNTWYIALLLRSDKEIISQQLHPLTKRTYESPLIASCVLRV